jgi:hypothetical protein
MGCTLNGAGTISGIRAADTKPIAAIRRTRTEISELAIGAPFTLTCTGGAEDTLQCVGDAKATAVDGDATQV